MPEVNAALEKFAAKCGVEIFDCGPGWGWRIGYKETGDATYREHCSYDRSERIYAEKDLWKLLKVVKVVER